VVNEAGFRLPHGERLVERGQSEAAVQPVANSPANNLAGE
jgi:hypothetical protein